MRAALALVFFLAGCGNGFESETEVGAPCTDDSSCFGDFACTDVGGGTLLCSGHCSVDADCGEAGRCVDVGAEGDPRRVCLRDCAGDSDVCPEGTGCTLYPGEPASVCR